MSYEPPLVTLNYTMEPSGQYVMECTVLFERQICRFRSIPLQLIGMQGTIGLELVQMDHLPEFNPESVTNLDDPHSPENFEQ